jgi:lipopolysaccharide export system permease protein
MKILPKYITRQALVTLFFTVSVFTFVLMLARMLKQLSEMLVNRQVGLDIVGWFILLLMPYVLSFSLPMAMLAAALLVFGRLSADNEITAIRASGVGLGRVASPVILLALVMTAMCFYINTSLAPWCRFQFRTLFLQLATENPMALLEEGIPLRDFPGYEIYVGAKKANIIEDVRIMALDDKGNVTSRLYAEKGTVKGDPVSRKLTLDLYRVTGDLRDASDPTNLRKVRTGTTADRYPIELDIGAAFKQARVTRSLQDLPFGELRDEIQRLRDSGMYPASALMEAHQRVAAAVACVAFTLIGIPLGIKTSRRETSIGIALSLGLALIWYLVLVLSNTLRNRPYLFPEAILWTPNLIFEMLGVWLLWRVSRV